MIPEAHIGNKIKERLEKRERSIAWLARKVNYKSSNLSKLLRNKYIHPELLFQISIALEIDFFSFYSEELKRDIENFSIK